MTDDRELFCCAAVRGRGPKVKLLHTACHDYWTRLEAAEQDAAHLRAALQELVDRSHAPTWERKMAERALTPADPSTEWCMGGRMCRCNPWHADRRALTSDTAFLSVVR